MIFLSSYVKLLLFGKAYKKPNPLMKRERGKIRSYKRSSPIWHIYSVVRASCSLNISRERDVSAKHTLRERTTYSI